MSLSSRSSRIALCAALLCATLAARGPLDPKPGPGHLCAGCRSVCELPLSHEDALLDAATDSYLLDAERAVAKVAAIALAVRLTEVHRDHAKGHFGRAWAADAAAIESLAAKPPGLWASSAEIRSLKRVRAALFADTIAGLAAAAAESTDQRFLEVYAAGSARLDRVLSSSASPQPMRSAERRAVCDVLAAYQPGE